MLVRAGATNRDMVRALGVDIRLLYTVVFGLGALLAGLAGYMAGPITRCRWAWASRSCWQPLSWWSSGGVGSIKGAFVAASCWGFDTMLRAFLPGMLRQGHARVRGRCSWASGSPRWGSTC
jgi:branched-chain amino acid transport system permease protein